MDNSILSRLVLANTFKYIQTYIPYSLTPNILTIIGLISMVCSCLFTFWFDPSLLSAPRLLISFNFLCLFIYFAMDSVDGIHARSTGRCSTFGNILDHCVDSCCCFFVTVALASSLRIGMSNLFLYIYTSITLLFYFSLLFHKFVGYFSFARISGCVEGITAVLFIHLLSLFGFDLRLLASLPLFSFSVFVVCCAVVLFNVIELTLAVISGPNKLKLKEYAVSLYSIVLLSMLFLFGFYFIKQNNILVRWALASVYACMFSLCYLEESISLIIKSKPNNQVFVFAFIMIALTVLASSNAAYFNVMIYILLVAFILAILRAEMLIKNVYKICYRKEIQAKK